MSKEVITAEIEQFKKTVNYIKKDIIILIINISNEKLICSTDDMPLQVAGIFLLIKH